jgi:hypothetical protein
MKISLLGVLGVSAVRFPKTLTLPSPWKGEGMTMPIIAKSERTA